MLTTVLRRSKIVSHHTGVFSSTTQKKQIDNVIVNNRIFIESRFFSSSSCYNNTTFPNNNYYSHIISQQNNINQTLPFSISRQNRVGKSSNSSYLPFIYQQIRQKTHVRGISKRKKAYLRLVEHLKAQGKEPPRLDPTLPETPYWKIEDGMKIYKNTSNGVRHRQHPTTFHLYKGRPISRLTCGKKSYSGRSAGTGRIIVRHRGGGHKKLTRFIDFERRVPGPHQVVRFEYDPNRSAELALLRNMSTNEYSYVICPKDIQIGDIVYSYRDGVPLPAAAKQGEEEETISQFHLIKTGNVLQLRDIPVGTQIHCIAVHKHGPGVLCRSAGTYGTLMYTAPKGMAHIKLRSSEVRMVSVDACATIGQVGNVNHSRTVLGKAGISRRLGRRPKVRGIAMSPYDHPHGGGRKSKGNKHPRSIWGWKTKGVRTVRFRKKSILVPRWKAKVDKLQRRG